MNLARSQHVFDYSSDDNLTKITLSNTVTFNIERDFNRHWRGTWKVRRFEERKDFERNGHCIASVRIQPTFAIRISCT